MTDQNVLPFRNPTPRREQIVHKGVQVTITYDVVERNWEWRFAYTTTIPFHGRASTLDSAKKAAMKKIEEVLP